MRASGESGLTKASMEANNTNLRVDGLPANVIKIQRLKSLLKYFGYDLAQ
ncbi:MAG: hypothetical protein U0525_04205 [Patescibacteria group bacterium]